MEAIVSDILQSRKQEPTGLGRTALLSLGAHAALFGLLTLIPTLIPIAKQQPRVLMSISLGGAPGPSNGGMQMLGGRRIDAAPNATEPEVARRALPVTPPPQPKMVLPDPKQKPRTPPRTTASSKDPKASATGRGAQSQEGTTRVETGARGQGFGLSTGGGGDGGVKLDTANFCCPEYIADMLNRIRKNWNQNQQASGVVVMKYTILRTGELTTIEVEQSSRNAVLDLASQRALVTTKSLAPLPAAFPDRQLTVHLTFEYTR
jgi:TonB family protein